MTDDDRFEQHCKEKVAGEARQVTIAPELVRHEAA